MDYGEFWVWRESVVSIDWDAFQEAFYDFLEHVTIISKDEGRVRLQIYDAQRYAVDEIFDGLRKDVHWFVIGKGRQVGITTLCYLFDTFYPAAIPGVQGAIVFDSADNLKIFRELFKESIASLPPSHRLAIRGGKDNRTYMPFENGNMLQYLVAGTKKGQGSLGRSRGINYCHASEVSYYGDPEAFENFKNTLSDVFPYRCYLFESTGKGYGLLYDLWEDALSDEITQKPIFVTWWRKRTYSYARGTALYKKYGWAQLSDEEREATEVVLRDYRHKISLEQWAWYRHRSDPRARAEGELIDSDDRQEIMTQEHPHFPEQMFRGTGSPFIPSQYIGPAQATAEKALFKAYQFYFGDEVTTTRLEPTRFVNRAQLKVWTEPHPNGTYVVSGDPAGGASEDGNNFCAQVIRCYADKQVQVAEFCDPNITPYQFAWVMLYLCGWYEDCRYILEINSYGEAVMVEMRNLVRLITDGRLFSREEDPGLTLPDGSSRPWRGIWSQVRQYLYRRQDSIAGGQFNLHFKTTLESKFTYMTQMADRFMLGELQVNSVPCLKEMRTLRKDGREIGAEVKKQDDRPVALALGVRAYIDQERAGLWARNATFAAETERDTQSGDGRDLGVRYMSGIMANHIAAKSRMQREAVRRARRGQRWSW